MKVKHIRLMILLIAIKSISSTFLKKEIKTLKYSVLHSLNKLVKPKEGEYPPKPPDIYIEDLPIANAAKLYSHSYYESPKRLTSNKWQPLFKPSPVLNNTYTKIHFKNVYNIPSSYSSPQISSNLYGTPYKLDNEYGPLDNSYSAPNNPNDSYGPPQTPNNMYGYPQKPENLYGPPHIPENIYGHIPENSYGPQQNPENSYKPDQISYGPPQTPANSNAPHHTPNNEYGPPQTFDKSYGPPNQIPSNSYGPPQNIDNSYQPPSNEKPHESYGPSVQKPSTSYGPPTEQNNQHGIPDKAPDTTYGTPITIKPTNEYGPPIKEPDSTYDLPQQIPPNNYGSPVKPTVEYGAPISAPDTTYGSPPQMYGTPTQSVHTQSSNGAYKYAIPQDLNRFMVDQSSLDILRDKQHIQELPKNEPSQFRQMNELDVNVVGVHSNYKTISLEDYLKIPARLRLNRNADSK